MTQAQRDWIQDFEELNKLIQSQRLVDVVTLADTLLKEDPTNELVLQAKIAALVYSEQYKAALETMKTHPEAYTFESAYCHVQLGEPTKALEILDKTGTKDIRTLYLLGQIYYKQGLYDKCISCYESIEKMKEESKGTDPNLEGRTINITSAFIQGRCYDRVLDKKYFKQLQTSADGLLNLSIALTEQGRLDEAYYFLKEGLQLRLKEDPQIEPYNDFQLHHLYILHHFLAYDTSPEAQTLRSQLKGYIKIVDDDETKLVLMNNKVATDRLLPPNASLKQLSEVKRTKNSTHEVTVQLNKALLLLRHKQVQEAKKELEGILKSDGDMITVKDERLPALYAENDKDKAIELMKNYIKQYLDSSKSAKNSFYEKAHSYSLLYAAQHSLSKEDFASAIEFLSQTFEASPKLCNNENYVVFTLTVLKKLSKIEPKAVDSMLNCIDAIAKELDPKQDKPASILLFMADTAMGLGSKGYQTASKIYEALMNAGVQEAEMGYLFTKCAIEGDDSDKIDKKLGEITIELEENYKRLLLDETKLRVAGKKTKPEEKKEGAQAAAKKRKHKKKKMPKNADPNNPPDPERWLPKWKRSKYRKKFGRKMRETQGEAAGTTQVDPAGPSTATVEVSKHKPKKK